MLWTGVGAGGGKPIIVVPPATSSGAAQAAATIEMLKARGAYRQYEDIYKRYSGKLVTVYDPKTGQFVNQYRAGPPKKYAPMVGPVTAEEKAAKEALINGLLEGLLDIATAGLAIATKTKAVQKSGYGGVIAAAARQGGYITRKYYTRYSNRAGKRYDWYYQPSQPVYPSYRRN